MFFSMFSMIIEAGFYLLMMLICRLSPFWVNNYIFKIVAYKDMMMGQKHFELDYLCNSCLSKKRISCDGSMKTVLSDNCHTCNPFKRLECFEKIGCVNCAVKKSLHLPQWMNAAVNISYVYKCCRPQSVIHRFPSRIIGMISSYFEVRCCMCKHNSYF